MNPFIGIIIRSSCVYFFMIIALQLFGKKELSQLNTADVILILLISNSVQNAMVGSNTSLLGGLTAALALFIINVVFKKAMIKSNVIKNLITSKPEILIHDGITDYKTLTRLGITLEELEQAIREHGIEHFENVKLAMFETNGTISVISGENNLVQTKHRRKHIHKSMF
ncbi:DUF421 domain-containing protein [Flavobacterium columnare]|uniref:DUF421 domain-containing protein n=1 Tax=Flavobacterium columnare TaxID=996 RepID=A0AAI8GA41_9FLAO|nr:YetF domain-containing protein [Flavobacterium columnare]AMO19303.1 DUF421 domain-containing protein [Flavobacterium columnare]AUX17237.1 hypothetical protein AQ623_02105 [Flavobacterium columnare]QOG56248.1 DUF421 domain-containing protein [Flavobacterium columnare]QOG58971.1 DUF421 domain-containing protein [Flavobacterium columnare]QOG61693.1 DUF421 domain-containing protein [Flavobacterium columnare]